MSIRPNVIREIYVPFVLLSGTMNQGLVRTPVLSSGTQVTSQMQLQPDDPIRPLDWLKAIPFEPAAWSDRLGWVGMEAVCCRTEPAFELDQPALTHHWLALFVRPPQELDLRYEGVRRHWPPPVGSIMLVPAGSPAGWRWSGRRDMLSIYLEPGLVGRVAAEAFDLDPARLTVPPLDGLELPHLRAAMTAVGAELASGGPGGPLAAESLANLLAVHLIRHVSAPRRLERGRDGVLPRGRLRAVEEYIEEHLDGCPTLAQLAAVVRLNPYHFARQFKAATGLPPHQYVILRRVERAKQLLQAGTDLSLAEVALHAGFSDL
jgi:AraC family transcriptional regulator